MKQIYVKWLDHTGVDGAWRMNNEHEMKPSICESIGWLVFENDEYIVVANSISHDAHSGDMCILKCCIKEMRVWLKDYMKERPTDEYR